MRNSADEIRRRYADKIAREEQEPFKTSLYTGPSTPVQEKKKGPRFNGSFFLFQLMAGVCLFLGAGILFKNDGQQAVKGQEIVKKMYHNEFQFAAAQKWYENQFGKPLALLPDKQAAPQKELAGTEKTDNYAVPASGKVYQSFEANGKGIMVETGKSINVDTVKEGYVTFIGKKDKLGKTVIIQHSNGEESWYGHLDSIDANVKLYSYMEREKPLGKVSPSEDGKTGKFYFAIKKGNTFVDPSKVGIHFE
ncbi:M23 family metallopeptidase [Fictibacillus enclensis]|uniref:M23 family metallopeptidase n=1 Tax=Fictibacillus enclensis TaxID=1017270 RepID=UPI0024C0CF59|nr:M23 family metallopeptidase [Fictibacillus enclensis]MDM5339259.1 M23 family metallopeptidase [Fictibacillus enclensis]WHY70715.1 M23 family metallopeptidase [Fictibacillus enclensis]